VWLDAKNKEVTKEQGGHKNERKKSKEGKGKRKGEIWPMNGVGMNRKIIRNERLRK
jgi:hypothetical protein